MTLGKSDRRLNTIKKLQKVKNVEQLKKAQTLAQIQKQYLQTLTQLDGFKEHLKACLDYSTWRDSAPNVSQLQKIHEFVQELDKVILSQTENLEHIDKYRGEAMLELNRVKTEVEGLTGKYQDVQALIQMEVDKCLDQSSQEDISMIKFFRTKSEK
jgi:hypothetical protein